MQVVERSPATARWRRRVFPSMEIPRWKLILADFPSLEQSGLALRREHTDKECWFSPDRQALQNIHLRALATPAGAPTHLPPRHPLPQTSKLKIRSVMRG